MCKKLILVLLLVAALLLQTVSVYAATSLSPSDYLQTQGVDTTEFDEFLVSYSLENYNIVFMDRGTHFHVYVISSGINMIWRERGTDNFDHVFFNGTDSSLKVRYYNLWLDGTFEMVTSFDVSANSSKSRDSMGSGYLPVYATTDIYTDTSCSEIFFYKAPTVSILLGVAEQVNMKELTMTEILGLVPLVIGLIIFCLGLRKAYRFLMSHLRQA